MPIYSDEVMKHFMNPHNVGTIEDADGIGEVGNPVCGDMMSFYIKVKNDRLEDVKFQTFGCGAAIAVSSMVSDMAKGKKLDEALSITNKAVAEALGGLPANKMHCSNLGADALRKAIEDYQLKNSGRKRTSTAKKKTKKEQVHPDECLCPYCDSSLTELIPFCKACGYKIRFCPQCGSPQSREYTYCSECGAKL